jgi:hypothetical protein
VRAADAVVDGQQLGDLDAPEISGEYGEEQDRRSRIRR